MSFFTQKKSSFASQDIFNTQDFQSSTETQSQFFDTQKTGSLSQQSQDEDDWESQISSIFSNPTSNQPVNHSAHLFTQTQSDLDRKLQVEVTPVGRGTQLSFADQENSSFSSPQCKRRAYGTPTGSNNFLSQASASSVSNKSSANIFGNNYQSQRDQPHSSSRVSEASVSSKFHTPVRDSNSLKSPALAPFQYQGSQVDLFNTQDDFVNTQKDDLKTQLASQEYSQPLNPVPVLDPFSQASSEQYESFRFHSQRPPSQHQLSQVSTFSEPMDTDFDIENMVPTSVRELHTLVKEKHSDAVFTWLISSQLCADAFPIKAYCNLKLSLLLSLASINGGLLPLPVIAVGQETSHANMIMSLIGKFAKRFVTSTITNIEGSLVTRDKEVCAGPLLLAQKGVLFLGEWSRLQPNGAMKLLRIIETGHVTMEKVQQSAPLECAVWSYWSCSNKLKKDASTVNQFISVFGIPTMIDDAPNDKDIVDHLLNSTRETNDTSHIDDDDMWSYLNYAAKQSVTMEPEAVEMLEDYYSAVRVVRPDALTPKAFEVLKQMAESHAKLSLRNQVIAVDALAALNICEKYIHCFFDKDAYFSPPEPQINNVDEIDSHLARLNSWFETFRSNVLHR